MTKFGEIKSGVKQVDRLLSNTGIDVFHSLRSWVYWYDCIPSLREDWLRPLMIAFDRIVREHAVFREIIGII